MYCCGWEGPKEFAYNNEPIDDSCYEDLDHVNSGIPNNRRSEDDAPTKKMKQDGCGLKLQEWFEHNKITWVTILASVAALQLMCIGISLYVLSRVKKQLKLR